MTYALATVFLVALVLTTYALRVRLVVTTRRALNDSIGGAYLDGVRDGFAYGWEKAVAERAERDALILADHDSAIDGRATWLDADHDDSDFPLQ